jgi:hypothetical protein
LYNPNLKLSIYFVRYGGLYACESQAIRIANKSVLFTSVEDKKKMYSVRQIAAADKALELLNEHCISTRSGIKLFSHVKDFPLTTQDFLRAAVIYGQDCECYRAATAVLKKPPPLNPEKLLYEPGDIALNIDIMHVPEIPFPMLASVGVPTHYSQVTMLKSRSYNDVEKAIDRHSKAFTKYKRNVQFHLSDGQPADTQIAILFYLMYEYTRLNRIVDRLTNNFIDIRYFFVTDRLKQGHLRVKHLGTSDMIADILTKPLTGTIFAKLRDLLLGYTTL